MAKSIYEILADLTTTTSVPGFGDEINHTLPEQLFPSDKQFESESELLEWAQENNCLHACMQKGIQKFLIEVRATFKGCKKTDVWSEQYGQDNVDKMEWKITERPNQSGQKKLDKARFNDCMQMIVNLTSNGMDKESIEGMVLPIYGNEIVEAIFTAITD